MPQSSEISVTFTPLEWGQFNVTSPQDAAHKLHSRNRRVKHTNMAGGCGSPPPGSSCPFVLTAFQCLSVSVGRLCRCHKTQQRQIHLNIPPEATMSAVERDPIVAVWPLGGSAGAAGSRWEHGVGGHGWNQTDQGRGEQPLIGLLVRIPPTTRANSSRSRTSCLGWSLVVVSSI